MACLERIPASVSSISYMTSEALRGQLPFLIMYIWVRTVIGSYFRQLSLSVFSLGYFGNGWAAFPVSALLGLNQGSDHAWKAINFKVTSREESPELKLTAVLGIFSMVLLLCEETAFRFPQRPLFIKWTIWG